MQINAFINGIIMSLTKRLGRVLLLTILILDGIAIFFTVHSLQQSRRHYVQQAILATQNLAQTLDHAITSRADEINLTLLTVADKLHHQLRVRHQLNHKELNSFLRIHAKRLGGDIGIRIANARGEVILGPDFVPTATASWNDRDFFKFLRSHPGAGLQISNPILGRVLARWVIAFVRRYNNPDGSFAGVVSAGVPIAYFSRLLATPKIGPHGLTLLQDSRHTLIVRYPPSASPETLSSTRHFSQTLRKAMASGRRMVTFLSRQDGDHIERIATYRRLKTLPFQLVVGMATRDYLQAWHRQVLHTVIALALFLLVTIVASWLLWRSLDLLSRETERNRILLHHASDGIHILDEKGRLIEASDQFHTMLGYSRAEMLGMHPARWDARSGPGELDAALEQRLTSTSPSRFETRHRRKNGSLIDVEISAVPVEIQGEKLIFYSARDISERKALEKTLRDIARRLQRLTDFNALLAQVNTSLASARDEETLLQEICDLAIHYAHFEMALIARPDASGWFQYEAVAGATEFLEGQRTSIDPDHPEGRGSFATVWREKQPVFIDNSMSHPTLTLWRDQYRKFGFKSNAVLPILRNGQIWGVFALFHAEINAFDDDLQALLRELSLDISRGLDRVAEHSLQQALLTNSLVGILLVKDRIIEKANLRASRMLGRAAEELEGQPSRVLYADDDEWARAGEAYAAFQSQREVKIPSVRMAPKDGSVLIGDFSGVRVNAEEGFFVWTIEDVTERERNRQELQRLSEFNVLLSEANKVMARVDDEARMLQSLCELSIQHAKLRLAWVGQPDSEGWFHSAAAAGAAGYLEDIRISAHPEIPEGRGPTGRTWRSQHPLFNVAFPSNPGMRPWAERAAAFGIGSGAALPIYRGGHIWAVFMLYHQEVNVFDAKLQAILTNLAQDIGHGLDRLDLAYREQETSAFNEALLNTLTAGVNVMCYPERIIERVNTRMLEIAGAESMAELLGRPVRKFYLDEETYEHVGAMARRVLRDGQGSLRDIPYRRLDGEIIYMDLSGQALIASDGRQRIVWTHVDVTERHQTEQTIRKLSAARATLLSNTTAGIDLIRYPERVIEEVNQGFLDILGFDRPEEVIGLTTSEIYPCEEENRRMAKLSREVLAHGHGSLRDLAVVRRDGRTAYVDISGQRLAGEDSKHPVIVWTSVDVSERHRLTEELARHALIDSLTELPNRRALDKEFVKAMARAKRHDRLLAVLMMDMDNFKQVNDTYGHDAGDQVLRAVGNRLQAALRRTDFVARMGGDEFVLLIEDCRTLEEVSGVLGKLEQSVCAPISLANGNIVSAQLSGGLCLYPHIDTDNPYVLLQHADLALYQNKEHKKDRLRFWTLYGEETPRQRTHAQKLLHEGGLRIFYQPVLDNHSRQIVGVEALARLQQEDGRILSPATFLPQLETGDLFALGLQVLDQALQDLGTLDREGVSLWVSVNLDPRNISATCVSHLRERITAAGIDPQRIYLEILEGENFAEQQLALEHLHALKAEGIRLALDDVGSAYSSLLRLKELPIDKVKLDQGFVRTLEERPQDLRFVEAILDLASGLGRELVVEGVETEEILDAVSVLGVPAMQGYGIAPPMPFAELGQFLRGLPAPPRRQPASLMGVYAKLLSNHGSRKKSLLQDLYRMNPQTLADATACSVHTDLLRLGVVEGDPLHRLHADYHRAIAQQLEQLVGGPVGNDWSAVEKAQETLLEAVITRYRQGKEGFNNRAEQEESAPKEG